MPESTENTSGFRDPEKTESLRSDAAETGTPTVTARNAAAMSDTNGKRAISPPSARKWGKQEQKMMKQNGMKGTPAETARNRTRPPTESAQGDAKLASALRRMIDQLNLGSGHRYFVVLDSYFIEGTPYGATP